MKRIITFILLCFLILLLSSCGEKHFLERYELTKAEEELILEIMHAEDINLITEDEVNVIEVLTLAGKAVGTSDTSVFQHSDRFEFENISYEYSEGGRGNEIAAVRIFPNLKKLTIYFQPELTDVSFLSEISALTHLTMQIVNVRDLTSVLGLRELNVIQVSASPIEKVLFHPENKITSCSFSNCAITDLTPFENLDTALISLTVTNKNENLTNLDVLSRFHRLESLCISSPELDSEFLAGVTGRLKSLTLKGKNIALKDAGHMSVLSSLSVSGADVDLADISEKNSLLSLNVENSESVDLSHLEKMSGLKTITLSNIKKQIDLTPLDKLESLIKVNIFSETEPIKGEKTSDENVLNYAKSDPSYDFSPRMSDIAEKYLPKN